MPHRQKKPVRFILIFSGIILFIFLIMQPLQIYFFGDIPILFPKGIIALKERNLLIITQILMLLVVVPVYILTFIFSWKYHAHHSTAKYEPNLKDAVIAEYIWWSFPFIIILIIGTLTYVETNRLDPFKPLNSDKKPINIQVVALQWKWLFIYPDEKIASINFFQFPEKTPLNFEITADAPMNSFWIPQLGGQIYAMPNMLTRLHLIAEEPGEYFGSSANISGEGFAEMHFIAKASTQEEYDQWLEKAKQSKEALDFDAYKGLAKPSKNNPVATFSLEEPKLLNKIMLQYAPPNKNISHEMHHQMP